jgi:hypothetical protein
MSLRKCPGCDGEFRKGTLAVLVGVEGQAPRRARVCPSCVSRGVFIVPRIAPTKVVKKADGGEVVERLKRMLRTYIAAAKAPRTRSLGPDHAAEDFADGRAAGLEAALECLTQEAARG